MRVEELPSSISKKAQHWQLGIVEVPTLYSIRRFAMNLIDLFTYSTLDGKRKLRRYVVFSLGILVLISLIFAYSQWTQAQAMADVQATALPVQVTTISTSVVLPTPIPQTTTTEACPSDSSQWELVDVKPNDNMKKISPSCVYDALGRSVAWALMTSQRCSIEKRMIRSNMLSLPLNVHARRCPCPVPP